MYKISCVQPTMIVGNFRNLYFFVGKVQSSSGASAQLWSGVYDLHGVDCFREEHLSLEGRF